MNIKQKIGGAIATAALLAATMMPVAAHAATVNIMDNGAFSKNGVAVFSKSTNVVKQSSTTVSMTGVSNVSKTGGNTASFNTGGSTGISTGGTTTTTTVTTSGGSDTNSGSDCGCPTGSTDVTISGNGAFSWNGVLVASSNKNIVNQSNTTVAYTEVSSTSNTGHNSASFNTGGDTGIMTGDTSTTTTVTTTGGSNTN